MKGVSNMTLLSSIFDLGIKPKGKKKKSINLNKQEKEIKRNLANHLMVDSFRGYRYFFSYEHGSDYHEVSGVNDFIKSITNNECFTEENYTVIAESILGNGYQTSLVNVNDLLGGK